MKKVISVVLILSLILSLNMISFADQQQGKSEVSVLVNGKAVTFEESPYIENNTTMVPVRDIAEALGAEVEWNQEKKEVVIKQGKFVVYATKDNYQMKNGRTFVPLRFVSESLGAKVEWNQETKTIAITPGEGKVIPESIYSGKYVNQITLENPVDPDSTAKACEVIYTVGNFYPTQLSEVLEKVRTTIESNGEYTGTFDDRALEIRKTEKGYEIYVGKNSTEELPQFPLKSDKEYEVKPTVEQSQTGIKDVTEIASRELLSKYVPDEKNGSIGHRVGDVSERVQYVYKIKPSDLPVKIGNYILDSIEPEIEIVGTGKNPAFIVNQTVNDIGMGLYMNIADKNYTTLRPRNNYDNWNKVKGNDEYGNTITKTYYGVIVIDDLPDWKTYRGKDAYHLIFNDTKTDYAVIVENAFNK